MMLLILIRHLTSAVAEIPASHAATVPALHGCHHQSPAHPRWPPEVQGSFQGFKGDQIRGGSSRGFKRGTLFRFYLPTKKLNHGFQQQTSRFVQKTHLHVTSNRCGLDQCTRECAGERLDCISKIYLFTLLANPCKHTCELLGVLVNKPMGRGVPYGAILKTPKDTTWTNLNA